MCISSICSRSMADRTFTNALLVLAGANIILIAHAASIALGFTGVSSTLAAIIPIVLIVSVGTTAVLGIALSIFTLETICRYRN